MYSCHLFLISLLLLVHTISVFYRSHLCMKYSLGIFNFLVEISSLFHSVVFLYFFALITEEGFLISPCYSLELYIQTGTSIAFCLSLQFFSQLFVRPPQTTTLPFEFLFLGDGLDHCLLYNVTNLCPLFFRHSIRSNPLNLFVTFTV